MTIEIPDDIYEDFLNFLDVAQASMFTEAEVSTLPESEQCCLKFIEQLLDGRMTQRNKV